MRKKSVIVILLTALILLSAAMLGVSSVYRVEFVCVNASLVSEVAKEEVEELQTRLQTAYEKEGSLSVDQTRAKEIIDDFPYFRLVSFEKSYPNRVVVSVAEDEEIYATVIPEENEYYILNAEGTVLGIRENYQNRSDNAPNLLITGLTARGEKGEPLTGDDCLETLFSVCGRISNRLDGIRKNVLSVEVVRPTSLREETMFKLSMKEGVSLYLCNPFAQEEEKVEIAMDKYLSLSFEQRLRGTIVVSEQSESVIAEYFDEEWSIS